MSQGLILYNGASGGLGRYLARPLRDAGAAAHALSARLEDQAGLRAELSRLEPSSTVTFVHLAARVSVPACEADPQGAYATNVTRAHATVATVLDWGARHHVSVRVIYVSSGHVYDAQPEGTRLSEDAPTRPRSVYAQTKLAAEQDLIGLASARGVPLIAARVFGLLSPQQAPHYVLPALIQRAKTGSLTRIPGLDVERDYLDARDVCEDLCLLASTDWPPGVSTVNVCSGRPIRIRDLLLAVLREVTPRHADALARRATAAPGRRDDVRWLVGDPGRFVALTGHAPDRIALATTVADAVRNSV